MNRSTWKLLRQSAALIPLAMTATSACTAAEAPEGAHGEQQAGTWTFHHEHVLGTSLELKVRAASLRDAQRAEAAVLDEFDRQDKVLSAWRPESEFSRWARTRFEAVPVSPELFHVLAAFDAWRARTDGALDPSTEAAARLWRQAQPKGAPRASPRSPRRSSLWRSPTGNSTQTGARLRG